MLTNLQQLEDGEQGPEQEAGGGGACVSKQKRGRRRKHYGALGRHILYLFGQ